MRAVQHFCVQAKPGERGLPSTPMVGDLSQLPQVLIDGLKKGGGRSRPACDPNLVPGPQHTITSVAGLVNCVLCRKTKAWADAPDDNPHHRKHPEQAPAGDGLDKFLAEAP